MTAACEKSDDGSIVPAPGCRCRGQSRDLWSWRCKTTSNKAISRELRTRRPSGEASALWRASLASMQPTGFVINRLRPGFLQQYVQFLQQYGALTLDADAALDRIGSGSSERDSSAHPGGKAKTVDGDLWTLATPMCSKPGVARRSPSAKSCGLVPQNEWRNRCSGEMASPSETPLRRSAASPWPSVGPTPTCITSCVERSPQQTPRAHRSSTPIGPAG